MSIIKIVIEFLCYIVNLLRNFCNIDITITRIRATISNKYINNEIQHIEVHDNVFEVHNPTSLY